MRRCSPFIAIATWVLLCWGCGSDPAVRPRTATAQHPAKAAPTATVEPEQVLYAMKTHEGDLRRCFFQAPGSRGVVRLSWWVVPSGEVQRVRVDSSSIDSPDVAECLRERVSELHFDRRAQPERAHWTYVFRLANPETASEPRPRQHRRAREDEQGVRIEPGSHGFLAPSAINSVVESGYKLYAHCYRDGLRRDPDLAGSVRVRFVVAEDGSVRELEDGASDLTDTRVIDCVAEAFFALHFPRPADGSVRVSYRVRFN